MRKLFLGILLLSLTTACQKNDSDELGTHHDLRFYCSPQKLTLEKWTDRVPIIFTGKSEKVQLRLDSYKDWFNGCWSKFTDIEVLKGHVEKEIWVRAYYNQYDFKKSKFKNLKDVENCPIKEGKSYLIFGYERESAIYKEAPHYIAVAKSEHDDCTPLIELGAAPVIKGIQSCECAHPNPIEDELSNHADMTFIGKVQRITNISPKVCKIDFKVEKTLVGSATESVEVYSSFKKQCPFQKGERYWIPAYLQTMIISSKPQEVLFFEGCCRNPKIMP